MKYSPKRFDTGIRALYCIALISSFVLMMIPAKGATSSLLSSIALILLAVSLVLFIKYDATKYEYILIERNGTFDFYVNNGLNHTWFLIFYIKTCGHCHRARTEISKLFPTYKDKQSLLFGQIDSQDNSMLSIRFNITQVPYLIAIKNNKMLEMEKYPNEKNLKEFIEIISNTTLSHVLIFSLSVLL